MALTNEIIIIAIGFFVNWAILWNYRLIRSITLIALSSLLIGYGIASWLMVGVGFTLLMTGIVILIQDVLEYTTNR